MLSGAQALEFSVESTSDHVLINTPVNTVEYVEFTEEFTLEPMYEQMMRINESLNLIKGLMKFSTQNNDCHDIGNLNSNTDDIKDLISIAKQANLTMLKCNFLKMRRWCTNLLVS